MAYRLLGIKMQSPLVVGSGPLTYGAPGMIRLHRAGAGAAVTKTINLTAAKNPVNHISGYGADTLINCEKWSDYGPERWIEKEIPEAKAAGAVVIASIGASVCEKPELLKEIVQAGADLVELVAYGEGELAPMVEKLRPYCAAPMLAKLSANYRDMMAVARACRDAGCNGFTACDSVGPAMKINIETGRPALGSKYGRGWLSGATIKPLIINRIVELRQEFDCPIVGLGGIMAWEDCIEYTMAGATMLGVCTAPMIMGVEVIGKLLKGMEEYLAAHGYQSLEEIRGLSLQYLPEREIMGGYRMGFKKEQCIGCRRCVRVCPYGARTLDRERKMEVDEAKCRECGLCVSVCPKDCLRA